jgi:lipoprotein-anchoring transpeptidase ErfK/SrfK
MRTSVLAFARWKSSVRGAIIIAFAALTAMSVSGVSSAASAKRAAGTALPSGGRITFIRNQLPTFTLPGVGKRPVKSVLKVSGPLGYGEYVWNDNGVPPGRIWIVVDLKRQLISVFRGEHEIGTAVTLYGADEYPTPPGRFRILARMKDHYSSTYDRAPMPYTLRLTNDGVSIHGNNVLQGYASHGCVGVPNGFARRLFDQARVGDEVFILGAKPPRPKKS